jgi:hypothetical protein
MTTYALELPPKEGIYEDYQDVERTSGVETSKLYTLQSQTKEMAYVDGVHPRCSRTKNRDHKGAFFSPKGSTKASLAEGFGRCGRLCRGSARQRLKRALILL